MRIIVCGAGSVGKSIVSYLVKGNNDIAVIDKDQRNLDEISKEFDVMPVLGQASHPTVLERAGAAECDLILAVTDIDEVNMVICQVAYTLFDIPRKIARINNEIFLDPLWSTLYNDKNIPIDLIISPDIDIAENILRILKYPGSSGVLPVLGSKGCILTLKLEPGCPLADIPLLQIGRQDEELNVAFVNVVRNGECFIPESYDCLKSGDEITVYTPQNEIEKTIRSFGLEKPVNERLLIFGGNAVAQYLGQEIEHDDNIAGCKIIEEDINIARRIALDLNHVVVIQGEMMSDLILNEADIRHADASIAVTDNDKDNLLISLIAAQSGVTTAVSVVNTPAYNELIFNMGSSILVDRSAVTISKILKEIRKTRMQDAYSVSRGCGEIWEICVSDDSIAAGKKIGEINLPKQSRIFVVQNKDGICYPEPATLLQPGDVILLYIDSGVIKQVEKIFS